LLCQKDYENFGRIERDYRLTITKEQLPIVPRIPIKWRETSGGYSSDSRGPRRFGPRRSGPRGQSNSFGSRRSSSNRGSFGRR
ncbi:MAG: hypothetical protein KKC54_02525, partial [Nanoarchaeota archaeon]|nr:hypothetical protein [Nanoarchaeota archaeon]